MNLLITGAWECANAQLDTLRKNGNEVVYMKDEKDELPCAYSWVEGVICNGLFLSHPIQKFSGLKYIQLTSAGLDRVPMDYVTEKNIEIHNARGVYSIPIAESVIGGVLQLYKKSVFFYNNQKAHIWQKNRSLYELFDKNVCIIGCGSVGCECAVRFMSFGCNVVGVDVHTTLKSGFNSICSFDEVKSVVEIADIVVITAPLNDSTYLLFSEDMFAAMKRESILVNVARGKIVSEKALLSALNSKLMGAVLDVFEEEPLHIDSKLWELDNVIIYPHNTFVGEGNTCRLNNIILNNIMAANGVYNEKSTADC